MSGHEEDRDWRAWVIAGSAGQDTFRFVAPIQPPGWEERPWVDLRPLSLREALRRDSIGLRDEYELAADGSVVGMRRTYDFEAMARFDLECCLVDMLLPVDGPDGSCAQLRGDEVSGVGVSDLLDRLPQPLAEWLLDSIEAVNMRRAEDREVLAEAKKD